MDDVGEPPRAIAGEILIATQLRLRARRDDLEGLVSEYDRVAGIVESFGDLGPTDGDGSHADGPARMRLDLLEELHRMQDRLRDWLARLDEPVREYEQINQVLAAYESASVLPANRAANRRRGRTGRGSPQRRIAGSSGASDARLNEVRSLLTQPLARAEVAERLRLSPTRVSEILEPLTRSGEVVEIRDPARPSRKLWVLAENLEEDASRTGERQSDVEEPAPT